MSKNLIFLLAWLKRSRQLVSRVRRQGTPARFPSKGKPTGKAGKHLAAVSGESSAENQSGNESGDNNNNTVKSTVQAGRKRRYCAGKARIYKRPTGS